MEFDSINLEGGVRDREGSHPPRVENALVGEVVDGQKARRVAAAPLHVAARQRARPVVEMKVVWNPVRVAKSHRHVGGAQAQPGEADVVVDPVVAIGIEIRPAGTVVQVRREDHIHNQPVFCPKPSERAGRKAAGARHARDDFERAMLVQHLSIAGFQDADIAQRAQRARQRGGDLAKAARLDEIGDFGRDEEHASGGSAACRLSAMRVGNRRVRGHLSEAP